MATRHRTPLLGSRRHPPDPATSRDPRVRRLITRLGALPAAASHAPAAQFRDELRQQLVAVTPRLIAEAAAEAELGSGAQQWPPDRVPTKISRARSAAARHIGHHRKPIAAVLSAVALFVMLVGGAVWISGRAVPGDSLYSLKRASENVQLSLTSGDAARGRAYLALASRRSTEAAELVPKSTPTAVGPRADELINSTLDDHDADVRAASQLLGTGAVTTRSSAPLDSLIAWAPGQLSRLVGLADSIPAGALHDRAVTSVQLVQRAVDRARQLEAVLTLSCLPGAGNDELGPRPVTSCPAPSPRTLQSPRSTAPGRSPAQATPRTATTPATTTSAQPGATLVGPAAATATGSPAGITTQPRAGATATSTTGTGSTPPGSSPSPQPTTNSCGVAVSSLLGLPVGIGIGSCGISIGVGGPN